MKTLRTRSLATALVVAIVTATFSAAAREKSEDELIQELYSPSTHKVVDALQDLEKEYPTGDRAIPMMKRLLTDPRDKVRRKAARVLGVLHANLAPAEIAAIASLLASPEPADEIDGLKALRGLNAPNTIPEILPLLQNPDTHVIRDACRTLAVLGNRSDIPAIEPLLTHPDPSVRKDAQDAILELRAKA
jgi:HEAT repeat protein